MTDAWKVRHLRAQLARAQDEIEEQRRRRLAIEEELREIETWYRNERVRTVYIERTVTNPMPPRETIKKIYLPERVVERIRDAGLFGRIGDRIDAWITSKRSNSRKR